MQIRGIDQAGFDNVEQWAATADPRDIALVRELLQQVEWQQPWKDEWYIEQFPGSDDYVVHPRPGLIVVVREFSDHNPEICFSVPYIYTDVARDEGS